jgi:heme A synthase
LAVPGCSRQFQLYLHQPRGCSHSVNLLCFFVGCGVVQIYNKGMFAGFRQVVADEGVGALATGLGPTVAGYFVQGTCATNNICSQAPSVSSWLMALLHFTLAIFAFDATYASRHSDECQSCLRNHSRRCFLVVSVSTTTGFVKFFFEVARIAECCRSHSNNGDRSFNVAVGDP